VPIVAKKLDIIAGSKSGTGKTASYILPMLNRLQHTINPQARVLRGLIIVPTRELVDQVSKTIGELGRFIRIKHTKIQGGISKDIQLKKLEDGIDIIVATPGRLQEFIKSGDIDLGSVNLLVLDEADTMLELGFIKEIEFIFSHCSSYRQILMFSATISQNIKKLAKEFLRDPVTVEVSDRRDAVTLIKHKAYKIDVKRKAELLAHLVKQYEDEQILIFANTKEKVDLIYDYLKAHKIQIVKLHGGLDYKDRVKGIKTFRSASSRVLVATDIAARGLDIQQLPVVMNYELPESIDEFTHRVGRTGRANNHGECVTLITPKDYKAMTNVEIKLKLSIKRYIEDGFELKDRQPRQSRPKKKTLTQLKDRSSVKKQARDKINDERKSKTTDKSKLKGAKSKKTTKRDANRTFRKS
jgi:ATP-dependent RNA helicase RhlE